MSTQTTAAPAVDKDNIRGHISAATRRLAELRYNTGVATQEQMKVVLQDTTGAKSLTDATARATWDQKLEYYNKLTAAIAAYDGAARVNVPATNTIQPGTLAPVPQQPLPTGSREDLIRQLLNQDTVDQQARQAVTQLQDNIDQLTASVTGFDATLSAVQADLTAEENRMVALTQTFNDFSTDVNTKLGLVDQLLSAIGGNAPNKQWQAKAKVAVAAQTNRVVKAITPYYSPGQPANVIVALCSPPGFGKSHNARMLGAMYDLYLEHGCSPDPEEINIMLGSPTVREDGTVLVVDGVLTQAMRAAASGANVFLFLDEIWRWAPRTQEKFLTFVTGVRTPAGKLVYRLATRSVPMGLNTPEVLECAVENLHIMTAGNLNKPPVEAFASRFEIVRIAYSEDFAREQGQTILDSLGIDASGNRSGGPLLAQRFATAMSMSRQMVSGQQLQYPLQFRIMIRAAELCDGTEADLARVIAERLEDNLALWDQTTGDVDPTSVACVQNLRNLFANI